MRTQDAEQSLAPYREAFEIVRAQANGAAAQRAAAFARFEELGFPPQGEEAWKYTNLRRLESRRFDLARPDHNVDESSIRLPAALAACTLVIVDGRIHAGLSHHDALPAGIRVRSLTDALASGEGLASLLRVPVGGGTERFAALNAALCPDVMVIDVGPGTRVNEAIHIVILASGNQSEMSCPRIVLRAGAGSEARIVLHHCGDDESENFVNAYVDVEVGPDALLHVYRLITSGKKTFHIERIDAILGQRAQFRMHDAQLGGMLARLDLNARLAAPGANVELTGLFLADGSRHLDTQVRVDHLAPDACSLQDYRGIAAGRGRAVFNSKAIVHAHAQKSDARQVSRNLLLSQGAEIDTKPELEIYADDVKCSHGATTGQLDPAALFYLRSRGLTETEARNALTRAFAGAVLSRMDHEQFADFVHQSLDRRLNELLDER
jgi:Fe-S cluster assembly protein SufD